MTIFGIKLALLCGVLIALNLIYSTLQLERDLDAYSPQHDEIMAAAHAEIIYLGDCSDVYCNHECTSDSSVSMLLQSMMPEMHFAHLSENGYHPEVYDKLLRSVVSRSDDSNKTVIVTLNLRAFADQIINDPYYDPYLRRQLRLSEPGFALYNRARLTFRMDDPPPRDVLLARTEEAQAATQIGTKSLTEWLRDYQHDTIATSYIQDFGFHWKPDQSRRLDFYDQMARTTEDLGWKYMVHLVPYNTEGLSKHVDPLFAQHVQEMESDVIRYLDSVGISYVNNFRLLPDTAFLGHKSNSHYRTEGKKEIARQLSRIIESKKK